MISLNHHHKNSTKTKIKIKAKHLPLRGLTVVRWATARAESKVGCWKVAAVAVLLLLLYLDLPTATEAHRCRDRREVAIEGRRTRPALAPETEIPLFRLLHCH